MSGQDYSDYAEESAAPSNVSSLKVPPHATEAERCLLGAILVNTAIIAEIQSMGFSADWFYNHRNRMIYETALSVFEEHGELDVIMCAQSLEQGSNGIGLSDLVPLVQSIPSTANFRGWVDLIRSCWQRRRWIMTCTEITGLMFGGDGLTDEQCFTQAQAMLASMDSDQGPDTRVELDQAIKQAIDYLSDKYENPGAKGVLTPYKHVNHRLGGLDGGQLIIIGARPGMGKTTYAMSLAMHAVKAGDPVLVYSLEMKAMRLALRMIASEGKIEMGFMTNPKKLEENGYNEGFNKLATATQALKGLPLVFDEQAGLTVTELRARALREYRRRPFKLIVLDYLQLVDGAAMQSANDRVGFVSRTLKKLAMELNIPVIALSQLNRKLEERRNKRPVMSDLRDSGAIEQDADVIQFLYRDEVYNENTEQQGQLEVISAKVRDGEPGTDYLEWIGRWNRINDQSEYFSPPPAVDEDLV